MKCIAYEKVVAVLKAFGLYESRYTEAPSALARALEKHAIDAVPVAVLQAAKQALIKGSAERADGDAEKQAAMNLIVEGVNQYLNDIIQVSAIAAEPDKQEGGSDEVKR